MTTTISGWIFDAYLVPEGVALWLINAAGRTHTLLDRWQPRLFVGESPLLSPFLARNKIPVTPRPTERKDFFTGVMRPVIEIRVQNPLHYNDLVKHLESLEGLALFNCDIPLIQAWHYERGHFPLAKITTDGIRHHLCDSPWDLDYPYPPLRYAYLSLEDRVTDPNHGARLPLRLSLGEQPEAGTNYVLDPSDPGEMIETLNRHIAEWDPDIILSDWGDSYIFPRLALLSRRSRIPLKLSRDSARGMAGREARSFFTYGRTVYQGGAQYLFGRWHLDMQNSLTLRHCGTDGLFEIARIAKIPVQRAARCTIGTALSSMQLDMAERDGILIPLHKQQTEDFREGLEFVAADKGGLVFEPEIGWHEGVGELDFVSMYPAIMVHHNVSPETVNCPCCKPLLPTEVSGEGWDEGTAMPSPPPSPIRWTGEGVSVPELRHRICTRRRGLIPRVLERILDKRARYKALAKTSPDPALRESYKRRYTAHKWALVTCFGYLGYKNARFGKIEAHECVSAWGREILLEAKDIAEDEGFHFLHAIVDSLWLVRPGATEADFRRLAEKISQDVGFPITLEGVYRWLRFCPSKTDAKVGVPNRYFGCFADGELKIRGIESRRHDTPPLFKAFQAELLARLARARRVQECRECVTDLEGIYESYKDRIRSGQVSMPELAFSSTLSKEPESYVHDTYSSIAAKQLAAAGIVLHPGETIQYVIASANDKVKDWRVMALALAENYASYDPQKYLELLDRAWHTLVDDL
jgi:DNA polymerase elongation subunit (family B)